MKHILALLLILPIMAAAQKDKSMEDAMKKMEELKKNMTPEQRAMLEKMGVDKTMQTAQKNMQQANASGVVMMPMGDPNKIPATVSTLAIPATPVSKEKLVAYLKPIFSQTEAAMKPDNVKAVQKLLGKGKQTGQFAMFYWANNELDKALYLLENACITDPTDYLSLNNLGALLTISGYAHKSLPLLLYAQKFVPGSSTLLNNIGQAYLSLGYTDKAKQNLLLSIGKDTANAEAQRTMALIARQQGDNAACAGYAQKAIQNGGVTTELVNLLQQVAPQTDLTGLIRPRFQKYYKDHSITKRFVVPEIPSSYEEAVSAYPAINAYFKNLDATIDEARKTGREFSKQYEKQVMDNQTKRMAQIQQTMANAGKPGFAKSVQDMKASLTNPFHLQGAVMLAGIDNPQYSKSYYSRMKAESENRANRENELKQALKTDFDNKINALVKEQGKLDGGEGKDAENARLMQIEKELCTLRQERQAKWLKEIAGINNQFIQKIEDLLNQRLQEYLFWNTIVMQSMQDPTPVNYQAYVGYLTSLKSFAWPLFPFNVDGGFSKPCNDHLKEDNTTRGKIQVWEREHCELDFGIDLAVTGGKMDCNGWSVYADFKAGAFAYERSVDPVTWETTGHSISAKAGKDKEFELTKNLKASIGATVETTIKFDGNMNPVDLIVKGEAGAEVKETMTSTENKSTGEKDDAPWGGKAGITLGEVEISVKGGFNSAGPSIPSLGSSFLK